MADNRDNCRSLVDTNERCSLNGGKFRDRLTLLKRIIICGGIFPVVSCYRCL